MSTGSANDCAVNLRRVMAQHNLTLAAVAERSGVHERTVREILAGRAKPHARTLHRLAAGLNVAVDELFQNPALVAHRAFDRATNPLVDEVVENHPRLFDGWSQADFDELYSRFGTGGGLTVDGTLTVVEQMNQKHELLRKVALILESGEAELLADLVEAIYKRIAIGE